MKAAAAQLDVSLMDHTFAPELAVHRSPHRLPLVVIATVYLGVACATGRVPVRPGSAPSIRDDSLAVLACTERIASVEGFELSANGRSMSRRVADVTEVISVLPALVGDSVRPNARVLQPRSSGTPGRIVARVMNTRCIRPRATG